MQKIIRLGISLLLVVGLITIAGFSPVQNGLSMQRGPFSFDHLNTTSSKLPQGTINGKAAGERFLEKEMKFPSSFNNVPEVFINVTKVDAGSASDKVVVRYEVEPKYVSREGFVLRISTWHDSQVYAIEGTWLALADE